VALVAGSLVAATLARHEPPTSVRADQPVQLGATGITWAPSASALPVRTFPNGSAELDGSSYLVSGRGGLGSVVRWDGEGWVPVVGPDQLWAYDVASDSTSLYVVGTGPATASGLSPARVARRDGDQWAVTDLPIDLDAIAAGSVEVHPGSVSVAAGHGGVVVSVVLASTLDIKKFLPTGVTAPDGWVPTAEGVDVFGPAPCPTGTTPVTTDVETASRQCRTDADGKLVLVERPVVLHLSWPELGVADDLRRAVLGVPFVFHAVGPGAPFEPVDIGIDGRVSGVPLLVHGDDGFDLATQAATPGDQEAHQVFVHSDDGITWRQLPSVPGAEFLSTSGWLDGRLAGVGFRPSVAVLARRSGDGWTTDELSELDPSVRWTGLSAIGPLGVAVVGQDGDRWTVFASRDGRTWGRFVLSDVVGEHVRRVAEVSAFGDHFAVTAQLGSGRVITLVASVG
jgi:hypothetical protein